MGFTGVNFTPFHWGYFTGVKKVLKINGFHLGYFTPISVEVMVDLRSTPHPVTVTNEGLGWDSLLKM